MPSRHFLSRSIWILALLLACGSETPGVNNKEISQMAEIYGDYLLVISSDSAKSQPNPDHLQKILDRHGVSKEQFVQGMKTIEQDGPALQKFLEIINARLDNSIKNDQAAAVARARELASHPIDGTVVQPRQVP